MKVPLMESEDWGAARLLGQGVHELGLGHVEL